MANSSGFSLTLPILDSKNYDRWRNHMKAIFGFQEVLEIVQKGYQEIGDGATEAQRAMYNEAKKKDCKALFLIYQGVDAADSIADYMTKILTLSNQMRSCGKAMKEKSIVEKVLRTLTCKYDHIVVAIEESKNLEELKIEELQASLQAHELRIKGRSSSRGSDQALMSRHNKKNSENWNQKTKDKGQNSRWKTNESGSSRKYEHKSARNGDPEKGKQTQRSFDGRKKLDKKKLQCYNCRNYGHFAS
ncbi:PREDICTED: uncharacterized protein LOC109363527 [Lupinus angustifolius]|uniref:uncharacterized protein LOC109363527 n=1 Tax=Lupinus angustifolius TaxID=3871 RepID=UPI00092E9D41|nr:PREDICTED: uncharacterized protein LOC109363527 [Lupinus angustifolius]